MSETVKFDYKNASKEELKAEYDRIAEEVGDDQFFTSKELNYLPEVLSEGEQVLSFTSGLMDGNTWLIALTDKRLIFLDKGMVYGLKQKAINLDIVNAVSGETGMMFGKITITDSAGSTLIDNVWKKTVKNFTNKVQETIEKRQAKLRGGSSEGIDELKNEIISLKTELVAEQKKTNELLQQILAKGSA